MTKLHWITALLGVLALILIAWNLSDTDNTAIQIPLNTGEPTYQSKQTSSVVYNLTGMLTYKLIADHIQYFDNTQITWLTQPIATMFNKNKVPTWTVKADQAKLTHNKMLYLYGHVQMNHLNDAAQIKCITTDNLVVNLITQDVSSDDEVTLYGTGFNSSGMKMRGNLRNKSAELIKKVKTSYEIQHPQYTVTATQCSNIDLHAGSSTHQR